jgi:predicted metal-dependent hydrolase
MSHGAKTRFGFDRSSVLWPIFIFMFHIKVFWMKQRSTSFAGSTADGHQAAFDAPVEVRRHPSARRMTLRVSRTRRAVIVTVPMQCNLSDADTFLNRHLDWIRERLGTLPTPVPFADGGVMPLRGQLHRIAFTGAGRGNAPVMCLAGVEGPTLSVAGGTEHAGRRLRTWLFDEARRDLDGRVMFHSDRLQLRAKRIAVRDQTSRWGSCSTTGVLSFSWRLVLAPPVVLDYVAAHEVAHLAEMNHGPRFWALVAATMPRMDEAKVWLTRYGMDLHRYGAGEDDVPAATRVNSERSSAGWR